MASRTLAIEQVIGNRVLDAASHVGRLTFFTLDAIRGLAEVKIWWPRMLVEAWDRVEEAQYWNPAIMDGAIPICHKGCALRQWLVIHGDQRGFVWDDNRVDNTGIAPFMIAGFQ